MPNEKITRIDIRGESYDVGGGDVTGVKGNSESEYRSGNVNITKANIGLGEVRNEDIGSTDISGIGATVKAAIKNLSDSFSQALTDLKATAIAQAVGATAQDTFATLTTKLSAIVNRGGVVQSLNTSTTSYTIPAGYHDGTGTVSITTETKTQAAGTSNVTVTPTSGKVLSSVTITPTPSQTKSVNWSLSSQTVTPDSGKLLSSVSIGATPDARTASQVATLTSADGRRVHSLREIWRVGNSDGVIRTCFELPASGYYENTDIIGATDDQIRAQGWRMENVNSGTYGTITSNGTYDMGSANSYRYVSVSVPDTALSVITGSITVYEWGSKIYFRGYKGTLIYIPDTSNIYYRDIWPIQDLAYPDGSTPSTGRILNNVLKITGNNPSLGLVSHSGKKTVTVYYSK